MEFFFHLSGTCVSQCSNGCSRECKQEAGCIGMCDYSCGNFCISDCTAYANSHSLDGTGSCACSGEHGCWETCYMRCTNGYCGSDCNRMCTGGYCSYQCSYGCGAGKFYSTLNIVFILYSK